MAIFFFAFGKECIGIHDPEQGLRPGKMPASRDDMLQTFLSSMHAQSYMLKHNYYVIIFFI